MRSGHDTIVALATARGQSALAVIRLSGPDAVRMVAGIFAGTDLRAAASHTVHVGTLRGADGDLLDQVVVTLFLAPRSVTGENVVEISCHGGDVASTLVMERLVEAGARPAGPGEFTQRAFLNGKMDLAQAESVGALIHARSVKAHRVSMAHLTGRYSALLARFRDELLDLVAFLELELDFSEEDVEFADRARLEQAFKDGRALLADLVASYRYGRSLVDGVRVAIAGRPNAGKSTLLNAVVGDDRAIVSDVAGTTRDSIEAESEFDGHRFIWIDTAGLRETANAIEQEGVARARRAVSHADVLVYVYDVTVGLGDDEVAFLEEVSGTRSDSSVGPQGIPVVLVANKTDLIAPASAPAPAPAAVSSPESPRLSQSPSTPSPVRISASRMLAERRLPDTVLQRVLDAALGDGSATEEHRTVTSARHVAHLRAALEALERAETAFHAGASGDMLVEDLRRAMDELGLVTGALSNEDVLDRIFSQFCIGK
ncbi:MAG: tRNA uridine-5-carboxymethylaminomethyl(34) synthesis GTPase MnmE [Rhodothermales bacterium]